MYTVNQYRFVLKKIDKINRLFLYLAFNTK